VGSPLDEDGYRCSNRLREQASAANPNPMSAMVEGSGTGAVVTKS